MILSHELFGTGKEGVIVMHDFYGCKDTWSFARKFFNTSEFTFAFTEVRGYGDSRHFLGEYSPKEASTDILKLADNLGWDSFHIMGHSMSGMLAQRVMLDGGSRVQSAILNTPVAASGLSFSPEGFALIEESIDSNKALVRAFNALAGERLGKEWSDFKVRQTRANRLKKAQSEYFKNCREFTLELSDDKTPNPQDLPAFWDANHPSFYNYMEQSLYGLRGIITDSITGLPIKAKVEIANHDVDSSHVYSNMPIGNYHRYIYQGNYSFTFSKSGYHSKTINASILNNNTSYLNVQLVPINFVNIDEIKIGDKIIESIDILGRENNRNINNLKIDIYENGLKTKKLIIKK